MSNAKLAIVAATMGVVSASSANAGLELVIKNTDAVPGIAGVSWNSPSNPFQTPSIDMSGNVGFRGALLIGGTVTSSNNATMWYGGPGSLNLVARTGNQAPGLPAGDNVTTLQSQNLPLSPNGNAWFGGSSTAPSGYVATGIPSNLIKVARNGETLPGAAGPLSANPGSTSNYTNVNNAGQTIISGQAGTDTGLWVGNGANLQLAYLSGQSYAGLPASPVATHFGYAINGQGALLSDIGMSFVGNIDPTNNQVLATLPFAGSTYNVIARELDAAPGTGGAQYLRQLATPPLNLENPAFTFNNGHFNNAGHVIYSAGLEGAGVSTANNAAMFYYNGTAAQLVRRRGDAVSAIPGTTFNITGQSNNSARLNNNDTMVWSTSLTQGVGGVTTANDAVLMRTSLGSSSDTLLAREGSNVPIVAGALWGTGFPNLIQNNADQLVFSTTMLDDANDPNNNVTTANDEALFSWDPNFGLALIAREGDSLASIGLNLTLGANWVGVFSFANNEGGANALTDNGWLTFRVSGTALPGFTDTAGIVRTQIVPEPATMGLGALALPLLMRRRRIG